MGIIITCFLLVSYFVQCNGGKILMVIDDEIAEKHTSIGDTVYFRCRPISPDYTTKLIGPHGQTMRVRGRLTFSPTDGFELKNVRKEDAGEYKCVTAMNTQIQEAGFRLIVHGELPVVKSKEKSENIIIEGDSYAMTCRSPIPLRFHYPNPEQSYRQHSRISQDMETIGKNDFFYRFIRSNTTAADSGWYGCGPKNNDNEKFKKAFYIFIKSEKTLMIVDDPIAEKDTFIGDSVYFRCRPTSPYYITKLIGPRGQTMKVGGRLTFDPKDGFTLKHVSKADAGEYKCITILNNKTQEAVFKIIVHGYVWNFMN